MYKEDYVITIAFDKNEEVLWSVKRKGEPHIIGDNKEELNLVKTACEEVASRINKQLK